MATISICIRPILVQMLPFWRKIVEQKLLISATERTCLFGTTKVDTGIMKQHQLLVMTVSEFRDVDILAKH